MPPPPGWYPDPGDQSAVRYWDGGQWTSHSAPTAARPQRPVAPVHSAVPGASVNHTSGQSAPGSPGGGFLGIGKKKAAIEAENAHLRELLSRMGAGDLPSISAERARLSTEVVRLREELSTLQHQVIATRADLIETQDRKSLQSFGLYDFYNPAQDSVQLSVALDRVRAEIKSMVRTKTAILASTSFVFNNSSAKGRSFVNNMSKIMLRAYNAEAENCIKTVKAGNLSTAFARLDKAVSQIEHNGTMIDLRVSPQYHLLRKQELELASQFQQVKQVERELERERRAELREQKRAEQELALEREKLLKERQHYANALESLLAKGDLEGAERIRALMEEADDRLEQVDYRLANERAGYVYVISNVGAFGDRMVKIGMTRRLEPSDRVKELGDASVPFRFDTHALFFSTDAVTLENTLHKAFFDRRVNKINPRREFFYATPQEVLEVLRHEVAEVVEFVSVPAAEEFRLSGGSVAAESL